MRILSGSSNPRLADAITAHLGVRLTPATLTRFSDGEIFVEILENVRGQDVFFIQSTCAPTNDHLMELLLAIDALRRGSAQRITAVIPYYGYARQDRKSGPRTPISAKLAANLITAAGADRVLTMDLHAGQIQGFFDIPTDNLFAAPVLIQDIRHRYAGETPVMVSPDVGGVKRARFIAKAIKADLAIIDKRRDKPGVAEAMNVIGEVKNRRCVLVDDIIDSAGTLCAAANALSEQGASEISAYATHAVFSGEACNRIGDSALTEAVVTDTIPLCDKGLEQAKVRVLSLAPLLGEAIRRIAEGQSVSSMFDTSTVGEPLPFPNVATA